MQRSKSLIQWTVPITLLVGFLLISMSKEGHSAEIPSGIYIGEFTSTCGDGSFGLMVTEKGNTYYLAHMISNHAADYLDSINLDAQNVLNVPTFFGNVASVRFTFPAGRAEGTIQGACSGQFSAPIASTVGLMETASGIYATAVSGTICTKSEIVGYICLCSGLACVNSSCLHPIYDCASSHALSGQLYILVPGSDQAYVLLQSQDVSNAGGIITLRQRGTEDGESMSDSVLIDCLPDREDACTLEGAGAPSLSGNFNPVTLTANVTVSSFNLAAFRLLERPNGEAPAYWPEFHGTLSVGADCPVWDIAGPISYSENLADVGATFISFTVATDDKGKITGTGTWKGAIDVPGAGTFELDMSDSQVKGKVKSSRGGPPKIQIKSKMTGLLRGDDLMVSAKGSIKISGEIDAVGNMQGTESVALKVYGQTAKKNGPLSLDVTPDTNNGAWSLNLDITTSDGFNLEDNGEAVLATGRVVPGLMGVGKLIGLRSKINLKNTTGGKVQVKEPQPSGQTLVNGILSYSLLGQKRTKAGILRDCH